MLTMSEVEYPSLIRTITSGIIENLSWNWDLSRPIFLGNGELTQSAPLLGATFIRVLGTPASPTILNFQPQSTILLGV